MGPLPPPWRGILAGADLTAATSSLPPSLYHQATAHVAGQIKEVQARANGDSETSAKIQGAVEETKQSLKGTYHETKGAFEKEHN